MSRVYVKIDEASRVTAINSDRHINDPTGWTQIDEGEGDKFLHAQGNYLPQPLMTDEGICRYKLANGKVIERTGAELQADIDAMPEAKPTVEQIMFRALAQTDVIPTERVLENAGMFPEWRAGERPTVGSYWRHADALYRSVQAHITQDGWEPDKAPALWAETKLQGEYRVIPDPITATQAFSKGEIGIWTDGKKYKAKNDGTVWTPAQYAAAWEEV